MPPQDDTNKWIFWSSIGLQIVQFIVLVLLSISTFFIKSEIAQIHEDRQDIQSIKEFMAETRGNRFTSSDGLKVYQEIAKIREQMAAIPSEVPPVWFKELVTRIEQEGRETRSIVTENSTKLEYLASEIATIKNDK